METKPWYKSIGALASLAQIILGGLVQVGAVPIGTEAAADAVAQSGVGLVNAVIGLLGLFGRARATKPLSLM